MRTLRRSVLLAVAIAVGAALAAHAKEEQRPLAMAADALSWTELSPQRPGSKVAVVAGDHTKGAWKGFIRFPAGAKSGVHTHGADLEIVVVAGTLSFGESPDREKPYPPGSYLRVPAGAPHSNGSAEGATIFVSQPAKYDTKPVDAKK